MQTTNFLQPFCPTVDPTSVGKHSVLDLGKDFLSTSARLGILRGKVGISHLILC